MAESLPTPQAVYQGGREFWEDYVKGRPHIPQSYFDSIFDYHQQNGGAFGTAHDVGAGPGNHSPRLVNKFSHVIVSDPWESNIQVAKSHLADQCTFMISSLEDSIKNLPAQSVDLVFCQSMWHYTRAEAIDAVAHQLKPGGTLAISMAGFPVFTDPKVWDIWTRMFRLTVANEVNKRGGPYGIVRRPMRIQLSQLDCVELSQQNFKPGAQRIKMKDPLGPERDYVREALLPKEFEDDMPHWSEIGDTDVVVYREVTEEWRFKANYQGLRDIVKTYPQNFEAEEQLKLWGEMKALLGDGETEGVWPYSLVLATRE